MKNIYAVFFSFLIPIFVAHAQTGSVGIGTTAPDASSALDITSSAKGLLIPRVNLTATNSASPITSPATSLLVYNQATAGSGATAVSPGYYYWNGSAWTRLINSNSNYSAGTGINISSTNVISNSGVVTASNGLTVTSNDVKLGGSLTQAATTVSVGSNTLNLTSTSGKIAIGPGASATGTYSTALGNNAIVSGTEAVAIGIANTGISKNTTAGDYSLAIGSNLTTGNGSNTSPIIAIGSDFTNNTLKSIMLGVGSSVPNLTLLGGSGSTPGNVGIGTITPAKKLEIQANINTGHIHPDNGLLRLRNSENTTCPGTENIWDFRVGNCGQMGITTYQQNSIPFFNILKASANQTTSSDGPIFSVNMTAPVSSLMIDADGDVGIGNATPGYKLDVGGDIRTTGRIYGSGSVSTYGAISIDGVKNSYAGINFRSGSTNYGTFMVRTTGTPVQGFYNAADNAWLWYWDNGVLTAGTVPVGRITGILPVANGGTGANTAAAARTNLGLGTIATQNADAVSITGGTVFASGNSGIGTASQFSANTRLSIAGGLLQHRVNLGGTYPLYDANGGWAAGWNFTAGGAEVDFWNVYNGGASPKGFVFRQMTGTSSQKELFRVTETGSVGINGVTSPQATLDVNGSIKTLYSGTWVSGSLATGVNTVNVPLSTAVPSGWDFTNTVVLIHVSDGTSGNIRRAKLTSTTNIELDFVSNGGGVSRFNYVILKL